MNFQHPERLLTAAAVAAGVLLLALVLRRRTRGRWVSACNVVLRAAALALLVLFLLEPVVRTSSSRPGAFLAAVDLSRSVLDHDRRKAWRELEARVAGDPEALVLGFGQGARVLHRGPASAAGELPEGADLESDPYGALALLALGPPAAQSARLALVTDGAVRRPGVEPWPTGALEPLVLSASGASEGGVRVAGLVQRTAVKPGDNVPLTVTLAAASDFSGRLHVRVGDQEVRRPLPVSRSQGVHEIPIDLPALPSGRHVASVALVVDPSVPDEPADNGGAAEVVVTASPWVAYFCEEEKPILMRALEAQEIAVARVGAAALDQPLEGTRTGPPAVLVIDRVATERLSEKTLLEQVRAHLDRGGGLFFVPAGERGALYGADRKPFLDLLPVAGRKPPDPPTPERTEDPRARSLEPPDPEARKREKRKAPTLGLVLVIDVSDSMKEGGRLRLAKEAAIKAAETLHPEDLIGIVAFNHEARVVLELTKARDQAAIADRIARIHPDGGTVFHNALLRVREMLDGEPLGVKHVIFLSDGASRGRPVKSLIMGMAARGITLSTVGCGRTFKASRLSDMAVWGRGKFMPAYSASEIPQVFTIEVERVVNKTGARRRKPDPHPQQNAPKGPDPATPPAKKKDEAGEEEEPESKPVKIGLPAPYTRGVGPHAMQGVLGWHPTTARKGTWVSLELEDGEPILAHAFVGNARVAVATLPLEGAWARHLVGWEDYQRLAAQLVRFLFPTAGSERFHVTGVGHGRSVTVRVVDRHRRHVADTGGRLAVSDERGRPVDARTRRIAKDTWRVDLPVAHTLCGVQIAYREDGEPGEGRCFVAVPPPPEIRERGLDLAGLQAWSRVLGGRVVPTLSAPVDVPEVATTHEEPWRPELLAWMLGLLLVDLVLKRAFPGQPREVRRAA